MDSDLAGLYQKYLAYMADAGQGWEAIRSGSPWLPPLETLTADQFSEMWRRAEHDSGYREDWLRRLAHGYEHEKTKIARSLAEVHAPRRAAFQAKRAA
jgi:hypothetical protein